MGLPFVPPGQRGRIEDMIHGVNYASAAAGILYTSGSDLVKENPVELRYHSHSQYVILSHTHNIAWFPFAGSACLPDSANPAGH